MKMDKNRIFRAITYFKRGHSAYFALLLSCLNFLVIQYRLLIEKVPILKTLFPRFYMFIAFVGIGYFLIATFVGYWDMRKGSYIQESQITWDRNPRTRELVEKIRKIDKEIKEIEKVLKEIKEKLKD